MSRPFCETQPILSYYPQPEKRTKTNRIERALLYFVKPESRLSEDKSIKTITKSLFGKEYVIASFFTNRAGYDCRHEVVYISETWKPVRKAVKP